MKTHEDMSRVLLSKEEIQLKVAELAKRISDDYRNLSKPVMICTLKGAVMFYADLIRDMDIDIDIDFKRISSYIGTQSSGEIRDDKKDELKDLEDRHVVIVEDIIDTGNTMSYFTASLKNLGVKSVKVCSLLSKPSRRQVHIDIDYLGFEIPDEFVIGYGLDYNEKYRNIECIGVLAPDKH